MTKLWIKVQNWLKSDEGQGMVEYGLIIAAIAVVVGAVLWLLGDKIVALFNGMKFTRT